MASSVRMYAMPPASTSIRRYGRLMSVSTIGRHLMIITHRASPAMRTTAQEARFLYVLLDDDWQSGTRRGQALVPAVSAPPAAQRRVALERRSLLLGATAASTSLYDRHHLLEGQQACAMTKRWISGASLRRLLHTRDAHMAMLIVLRR